MKLLRRTEVEEELRRIERGMFEYSTVDHKVVATFIIIFGMWRREGV